MQASKSIHFRKFAPIDREHPIFELVDGDTVLLAIGATDDGVFEIAVHEGAANRVFTFAEFLRFIEQGRQLAEDDLKQATSGTGP